MAVARWGYNNDSDDELAEEEDKTSGGGKSLLLVVIDASPAMFQEWKEGGEGDVPFRAAIKCCQAIWRSKVVSNQKDLVSLLFLGTEQSKNSLNFGNIYQLQELSQVKVAMIEELNKMKDSVDYDGFESKIGSSEQYILKDLFWLLKIVIDEGKASTFQKKIIYFTCNDSPHSGKPNMQKEAERKFKDMGNVKLSIVTFNAEFSLTPFYSKLVEDETSITKAENLEELLKVVRVKQRLRRPITRSTLNIGEGLKIGIGLYSFVRPAKKPEQVRINKKTSEVVQRTVNEFRTETGLTVLKSEERKMVQVQGEKIILTKEEVKQVKDGHEQGMHLIGFLDGNLFGNKKNTSGKEGNENEEASSFNHFVWYRSPGYFIYPDDERITGSRDLFIALLKRCHTLNKTILVKMVMTRGKTPKLACLIPSLETENAMFPQGFHVFPVPFTDEMRQYDFNFRTPASTTLISLMEKVIKKVTNKGFDVLDVYNPMLQYQWRDLERIALDLSEEEQEDDFNDLTEPNEDLMLQRLGDLPRQIQEDESLSSTFTQQKSTVPVLGRKVDMAMEVKNKRVDKLTVPVLKDFLDSKKVGTYGKRKADCVAAVYEYFKKHGN